MTTAFNCPHLKDCGGCQPLALGLTEQQNLKVASFRQQIPIENLYVHSLGEAFLRTRMDLTWSKDHWGLWCKDKTHLVNLENCQQLSLELQMFFSEFKKIHWPIQKGSARIRKSPQGQFGVWLDLANEDVRDLFASPGPLLELTAIAKVEIGQKRKRLVFEGNKPQLKDPVYEEWTSTFVANREIPLMSLIGGFSQTGPRAQRKISQVLEALLQKASAKKILEFGAGAGALSLPAASEVDRKLWALELEKKHLDGLRLTLEKQQIENIELVWGDFQRKCPPDFGVDTYLVNPPRSGIGDLFRSIPNSVRALIYMSCYPESFFKNVAGLHKQGFSIQEAHLIDQFPQTPHAEWMSLWQRT